MVDDGLMFDIPIPLYATWCKMMIKEPDLQKRNQSEIVLKWWNAKQVSLGAFLVFLTVTADG